jgi:hypothetical protein
LRDLVINWISWVGEDKAELWLKNIFYSNQGDAYKILIAFPEWIRWYIDHLNGSVNDFFDEMKSHSDRLLFLEAA